MAAEDQREPAESGALSGAARRRGSKRLRLGERPANGSAARIISATDRPSESRTGSQPTVCRLAQGGSIHQKRPIDRRAKERERDGNFMEVFWGCLRGG